MLEIIKSIMADMKPNQGCARFAINLTHVLDKPTPIHAQKMKASAHVFLFYDTQALKAVVVMADGNTGTSITNGADTLLPFIHREHLSMRNIPWRNVRWIYRDTEGLWSEIVMNAYLSSNVASVGFKPAGNSTESAMYDILSNEGFTIDGHDRAHIRNTLAFIDFDAA
jgi:hypothetical protein